MKYCEDYAALLDAYFDGECTPEEAERVRAHIAGCPGCRAYLNELALLRDAFPDEEDTEVPEGFADGVMAAIRADAAPQKRPGRWKRLVPMAACLALIVLAVNQLPPMTGGNSSSTAAAPAAAPAAAAATDSAAAGTDIAEAYAEPRTGETPQFFTAAAGNAGENGAAESALQAEEKAAVETDTAPAETPAAQAPQASAPPAEAPAAGTTAVTAAESAEKVWLARLTVTAAQAEGLADSWTPLDSSPEGDRYTLTPAQLEELLALLGDDAPAYEPGEGELALVTVVP
ncbi:anti-sigma factor family protein [Dysosmobacter sp.]|uniref:anti-sigma factor family protein n=1 Tax=Dysosmobacter sp. TaxID=2591382 RepID=UPI002A84B291|nr:anti-sigma factor [Dysosmobacter sp.]MDY3281604.1 anti-sigma factor [Dysosmobacter sp.]